MYLHHGEDAYFSSGNSTCQRTINNLHYSLAICADTSNERHVIESIIPQSKFYLSSMLISHAGLENDLARLQEYARKYNLIVGMANLSGNSGGYHCAGNSGFYNSDGEIITRLLSNATGIAIITYYDDNSVIGKSISINNKVIAVKEHISNYPIPITLTRGVKVKIAREDTLYAGWLFCTNSDTGISGWCPKQIIKQTDAYTGISLENYSANELNVDVQQQLLLIRELNDWAWCFDGVSYGWIPLANLQPYT